MTKKPQKQAKKPAKKPDNGAPKAAATPKLDPGATVQGVVVQGGGPKPTVSHMLGEICWLFSQSPLHKHFSFGDAEWIFMPAMLFEQYRVFRSEKTPIGLALWAYVSEEVEKEKFLSGVKAKLRPDEWKCGDRLWLVELIAPFATEENKMVEAMLTDLVKNVFKGKTFKFHKTDPATGKREVVEIKG